MNKALNNKVVKLVNEINAMLPNAIDQDGDALNVIIDTNCTVEHEESVKSITFKNSRLAVVIADWLGKERKEVFSAKEIELDALPYLRMIKRAYTKAMKL